MGRDRTVARGRTRSAPLTVNDSGPLSRRVMADLRLRGWRPGRKMGGRSATDHCAPHSRRGRPDEMRWRPLLADTGERHSWPGTGTLTVMSHTRLFQILVVASAAVTAAWYALPHIGLAYDARTAQLLGLSGDGASPFTQNPMFYLLFAVAKLVSTIGLLLRANWGRWVLVAATGASLASIPFSGMVVAVPLDCLIGTVLGYGDGAILALAFCGPISDSFRKTLPV